MIFLIFSDTSFSIYFPGKRTSKWTKMGPQIINQTFCLRFVGVLEEDVFSRFLERKKIGPKSRKIWKKVSEGAPRLVK